jgi:GMP synthase (glutamine-hydrolysing)
VEKRMWGLQFHPEVTHSPLGKCVLENFCIKIAGAKPDWVMTDYAQEFIDEVRAKVGNGHVMGAVSGGVDSTVAAVLMTRAIGDRFHAVLVDNGCLRQDEAKNVLKRMREDCGVNLRCVYAADRFLGLLKGVTDPETKRKIIGTTFIEIFQEEANVIEQEMNVKCEFLLQGTLYPDVIESISYKGPSACIKTHHNVGGLPATMKLKLIEPLRELFKDEVRELGMALGIDEDSVWRHPFPGPGLAIRILGEVTAERVKILQEADAIVIEELHRSGHYRKIGQAFVVLLPCKSVGVMGDGRTYENVASVRCVETTDYMTADFYPLPYDVLGTMSSRVINEVRGINRLCYDISSKPPATIEWE